MENKGKKPERLIGIILSVLLAAVLAVFVFGVMNY